MPSPGAGICDRVLAAEQRLRRHKTRHGHPGWTLSAATAELIAEDIVARFRAAIELRSQKMQDRH
jgi:hypothetical protein